jgi:hypothetical protein
VIGDFSVHQGLSLRVKDLSPSSHRMLFIRPNITGGQWPIPEAYLPEPTLTVLPPRAAQPTISVATAEDHDYYASTPPKFPVDQYEVQPGPLSEVLRQVRVCVCVCVCVCVWDLDMYAYMYMGCSVSMCVNVRVCVRMCE